jgi:DNA-binding response OmpR family regulator
MNGHDVTVAKDGREGVESFMQGRFNLVLTDLGLPGLSGWDVASAVKKHNPGVVVAILTGWGIQLDELDLKKSGANFILNKPFTMDELLRMVNDALALKNGA